MTQTPALPPNGRREPREVFSAGFTLFADMLLVGLLTAVACLPVVTAPAAFAAASATLRRAAEDAVPVDTGTYAGHLRARLTRGSLAGGLAVPLLAGVLLVDSALTRAALPGADLVAPALALLTLGIATVALRTTALPAPHALSPREGLLRLLVDLRGTFLLAGAVVLAALLAWSIPGTDPPPGPLAFAATVVDLRPTGEEARPAAGPGTRNRVHTTVAADDDGAGRGGPPGEAGEVPQIRCGDLSASARIVLVAPDGRKVTATEYRAAIDTLVAEVADGPQVAAVSDPLDPSTVSEDGSHGVRHRWCC
ncbi:hypothetical protein STENM327S_01961 [Streptomyces tendae]